LKALQYINEVLGKENLDIGKYTQIRLTVEKAIIINNNDVIEVYNLTILSGKIKLIKTFWIYEDETTVLILDFDLYKLIH
jgi:hypothetical protein